ncbi:MAG: hypothetical protein AAGA92_08890, partial [Planctomycetota bacterium]
MSSKRSAEHASHAERRTARRCELLRGVAVVLAGCLLVGLAGCRDPTGRQQVTGTVTLDGDPLPEGRISLRPLATGPSAGGKIVEGQFEIDRTKGPLPGAYTVSIQSYKDT